jgi:hypothetical protein
MASLRRRRSPYRPPFPPEICDFIDRLTDQPCMPGGEAWQSQASALSLTGPDVNQYTAGPATQPPDQTGATTPNTDNPATPAVHQDQFVPSILTQGQQNTGLFTVNQFAPFTAAADAFLAATPALLASQETATLNANVTPRPAAAGLFTRPAPVQGNPATPTVTVAPTVAPNTFLARPPVTVPFGQPTALSAGQNNTASANANPAPAAALATAPVNATVAQAAPVAAAGSTSAAATGTASIAEQLQTLNNALRALGLTVNDIHQIDRIASVINDFNPSAFTSLAYQLAALAPNPAQQAATTVAGGQATVPVAKAAVP